MEYSVCESLYAVKVSLLLKMHIENWRMNRYPDQTRIPMIANYIKEKRKVEGIIYLARTKDNEFICYDGIHRILALKYLETQCVDCNDINVVVDVMDYNEHEVSNRFKALNSCVPVPSLYTDSDKKLDELYLIKDIVKHFKNKYKARFSINHQFRVPNMNEITFTSSLEYIIHSIHGIQYSKHHIINKLEEYNEKVKYYPRKRRIAHNELALKLTDRQEKQCEESNMYLFALPLWEKHFVTWYINQT